jgi:hypothetical protein
MSLRTAEYIALRRAIARRGQLRVSLAVAGVSVWALLLVLTVAWLPYPAAAVVPLVPLLATFEAVRSLNAGAERMGRYLQVWFEDPADAERPAWEHTAMAFGPKVPGAGGHPLFLPVFLAAIGLNLLAVMLPQPVVVELVALAVPHLAFVGWVVRADLAMRRQRAADLERLRAIKTGFLSQAESGGGP